MQGPWWPQLQLPSETEPERLRLRVEAARAGRGSTAEGPAPRWATWASGRLSWLDTGWGQKQTCRRAAPVLPQIPGHLSFLFPPGLRDQNPTPQLY